MRSSRRSPPAGQNGWVDTSTRATPADTGGSRTTRAATATVRSVREAPKRTGSKHARPKCYLCPTRTSSSPCRRSWHRWRSRTHVFYGLLLRTVGRTLQEVALNPKHLGARIGFFAVLHTWGQTLVHHPHVHCVVPAGGLAEDGRTWRPCRSGFFLPVRVLSRLFRGKFTAGLSDAFGDESLELHGALARYGSRAAFARYLRAARRTEWVVYAKPPFDGPKRVLEYLARYTHRVAISNHRLLHVDDQSVRFRYKDYRGCRARTLTLPLHEFARRFLLHVLPKGFVRIRYYGLFANASRARLLACSREALGQPAAAVDPQPESVDGDEIFLDRRPPDLHICPSCRKGVLRCVQVLGRPPPPNPWYRRVAS